MFRFLGEVVGEIIGVAAGVALAPIMIALQISEATARSAVEAGCRTTDDVRKFLKGEW